MKRVRKGKPTGLKLVKTKSSYSSFACLDEAVNYRLVSLLADEWAIIGQESDDILSYYCFKWVDVFQNTCMCGGHRDDRKS